MISIIQYINENEVSKLISRVSQSGSDSFSNWNKSDLGKGGKILVKGVNTLKSKGKKLLNRTKPIKYLPNYIMQGMRKRGDFGINQFTTKDII